MVVLEFMLEIIKKALEELTQNVAEEAKKNSVAVQDKLLELLKLDNKISARSVIENYEIIRIVRSDWENGDCHRKSAAGKDDGH